MYTLTTSFHYGTPHGKVNRFFDTFKEGLSAAEYTAEILKQVMGLTRHFSVRSSVRHMNYYADLYNEVSIVLKEN